MADEVALFFLFFIFSKVGLVDLKLGKGFGLWVIFFMMSWILGLMRVWGLISKTGFLLKLSGLHL